MSHMWPQYLDVGSPGYTVRFYGFSTLFSVVTTQLLFSINSPQGSQFPPLPLQHVYLWGTFDSGHLLRSGALVRQSLLQITRRGGISAVTVHCADCVSVPLLCEVLLPLCSCNGVFGSSSTWLHFQLDIAQSYLRESYLGDCLHQSGVSVLIVG